MGVDEGEDSSREGHYHVEEGEEDPRQQQESSFRSNAMNENQSGDDVDDGHQQKDGEEDVRGSIGIGINNTEGDGVVKLYPFSRIFHIEKAVDGHDKLKHTNAQKRNNANGQRSSSQVPTAAATSIQQGHGAFGLVIRRQ